MGNGASVFYCAHTRFNKVSTGNIFTCFQPQPELVLTLLLIFGQSG